MNRSKPTESAPVTDETEATLGGKGRATPTRREKEAANRRPLVPNDRKEANRQAKTKLAAERERARVGLANGEERFLPARDKGEQRRFVRDVVDSRFGPGEFLIPVMVVVLLLTAVPMPQVQVYVMMGLWGYFLLSVLDAVLLGRSVTKRIAAHVGADKVERGLRWYTAMRAFQLRVLRLPKPRVKRGQRPAHP